MTVIDSKQLTSKEFKTTIGCEIAVPGSAFYAESEQCFRQRFAAVSQPGYVSPAKGDGKTFKRSTPAKTEDECILIACSTRSNCSSIGCRTCIVPIFTEDWTGFCIAFDPPPPSPGYPRLSIPFLLNNS